jgi:hypothetical protein
MLKAYSDKDIVSVATEFNKFLPKEKNLNIKKNSVKLKEDILDAFDENVPEGKEDTVPKIVCEFYSFFVSKEKEKDAVIKKEIKKSLVKEKKGKKGPKHLFGININYVSQRNLAIANSIKSGGTLCDIVVNSIAESEKRGKPISIKEAQRLIYSFINILRAFDLVKISVIEDSDDLEVKYEA